jgi:hypothetical protein
LCHETAIATLDDERTAPGVVALAALRQCIRETEESCKTSGLDPKTCNPRSTLFEEMLHGELEDVTASVLEYRAKRMKAGSSHAETAFHECVVKAIATLDDRVSPADVIAAGAVEDCRHIIKLPPQCHGDCEEQVISGLKTRTLPLVLKFRAARR